MARFVLSVGCGNFDNGDQLPGAINDAREFYHVMLDETLGAATPTNSVLLLDPTVPTLLDEISDFFSRLTTADEYFLFFASHAHPARTGYAFRCRNTPPKSAFDSFSFRELKVLVTKSDARGTLIFDTCYSGEVSGMADHLARGEGDAAEESASPEAPREGTILIWSCDSKDKAYENKEHGVFSECLLAGIRSGADLPPNKAYVTAGSLVSDVVGRLLRKKHKGSFPSLRVAGDVAGMFVSKNPKYVIGAGNIEAVISESIAQRDIVLSERSCEGIQRLARSILREETKLLPRLSTNPHALQASLFFIPVLGSEVYFSKASDSTVLITENGFYRAAESKSVTFVWEAVESVETYTDSFHSTFEESSHEDVIITFRPTVAANAPTGSYAIRANKHPLLARAIEWGRSYRKGHWKWNIVAPKPPVRGREVAIFAPLAYDSMRTIPASQSDASEIARVFHASNLVFNPITATEFKSSLRGAFQSAYHKTLILYYSGHGIVLENELFLTAQYSVLGHELETAVPVFKLSDLMSEYQVINLVLILDCCYSGAAGDNLGVSFDALGPSLQTLFDADQFGITIIASSGRDEKSFDVATHSVFTDAIVHACSIARSKESRVTVGGLIGAIPEVMSDQCQRMRVFVSQQGEDVVLADDLEDGATRELAEIAARVTKKSDQFWNLKRIDLRLLQGYDFALETVHLFRREPIGIGWRIPGVFLAFLALEMIRIARDMVIEEHFWIFGTLVGAFFSIMFGLPAWMILTDTDKNHYMMLSDSGVLIREGRRCEIVPALSLMSIQRSKSHRVSLFMGSVSLDNRESFVLIRDDGDPVDLPIWMNSHLELAIKGVNQVIDSTNRNFGSSGHRDDSE